MKPKPNIAQISTRAVSAAERLTFWREIFGRQIANVDIEPLSEHPFNAAAELIPLPGVKVGWCQCENPALWRRTAELVKSAGDELALLMPLSGTLLRTQRGRELEVGISEAVSILEFEPATIHSRGHEYLVVIVPRKRLAPLLPSMEDASTRVVRNRALELLKGYVEALRGAPLIDEPALCSVATNHICDLVALALGARDGNQCAPLQGLRAARMRALKEDLVANPTLSLGEIAERQGVTPRYLQLLFQEEGTTFAAYAQDQRLANAWRMLTSPHYGSWTVSRIALEAGFGDLSHFNRSFRRRYGISPSDARALDDQDAG